MIFSRIFVDSVANCHRTRTIRYLDLAAAFYPQHGTLMHAIVSAVPSRVEPSRSNQLDKVLRNELSHVDTNNGGFV